MSVKLYRLLPEIIRLKDELAVSDTYGDVEGNLEKIVWALEQETDTSSAEIAGIPDLVSADRVDQDFLLLLSLTLGTVIGEDRGEAFQRWLTQNLISFYKISGTHLSWDKEFTWSTGVRYRARELWKTTLYERGDYSREPDYTHTIKAARVDLYTGENSYLTPSEAASLIPVVEPRRPIHVILRKALTSQLLSDTRVPPVDGFEAPWMEEAVSEASTELATDVATELSDALEITLTCTAACQSSCQGECETAWQAETGCSTSCETACQYSCESLCQDNCQIVCQGGCEYPCEEGCQLACTAACQSACTAACQGECEIACELGVEKNCGINFGKMVLAKVTAVSGGPPPTTVNVTEVAGPNSRSWSSVPVYSLYGQASLCYYLKVNDYVLVGFTCSGDGSDDPFVWMLPSRYVA